MRSSDFEILLFAYSLDYGPVIVVDIAQGEKIPNDILFALFDDNYIKSAYNAPFEWGCLNQYLRKAYGFNEHFRLPPSQWRDTMLKGLYCGFTAGLEATGRALGLPEDKQKLNTGKALIRYFCVPCKPTKTNGGRTRNYPHHDLKRWELFKEYNRQDVITEMEIDRRLSAFTIPDFVQKEWETDLIINDRGVAVDMSFVEGALDIGARLHVELMSEARELTGLQNPNSVKQLAGWIEDNTGIYTPSINKTVISELLQNTDISPTVRRVCEIRQELGKTSTKKYNAIQACVCPDKRVRGLLQFYGANRTGRWAGRLVQVQNLPRTYTEPLELARNTVKNKSIKALSLLFGSPNDTLSQLIRTSFVAADGNVLIDADFSAIEARVISWLAGEEWRLEVFRTHGKIYEASASQMFNVPIERIKKGNPEYALRQRGKVAELALGYQGSVGAMRAMDVGGLLADSSDDEVKELVTRWRETNPKIRDLWYGFDKAAIEVINTGVPQEVNGIVFRKEFDLVYGNSCLSIQIPSGRKLFYNAPQIGKNEWDSPSISYMGMDQTTKKWKRIETYGGKLVENVVQAIARDCLAQAIQNLEKAGYPVVFHVHDEVVIDITPFADEDEMLHSVTKIMAQPISWAEGLPLNAEGWVDKFFKKD